MKRICSGISSFSLGRERETCTKPMTDVRKLFVGASFSVPSCQLASFSQLTRKPKTVSNISGFTRNTWSIAAGHCGYSPDQLREQYERRDDWQISEKTTRPRDISYISQFLGRNRTEFRPVRGIFRLSIPPVLLSSTTTHTVSHWQNKWLLMHWPEKGVGIVDARPCISGISITLWNLPAPDPDRNLDSVEIPRASQVELWPLLTAVIGIRYSSQG